MWAGVTGPGLTISPRRLEESTWPDYDAECGGATVQRGVRSAAGQTTAAVLAAVVLVICAAGRPGPQSATAAGSVAQLPTTQDRHMVVESGGKVYVMGGWIGGVGTNRVDAYDPATNQWTRRADMLTARFSFGAARDGSGRIYAVGGVAEGAGLTDLAERYDPATNVWTPIPALPEAIAAQAMSELPNGDVLVAGGQTWAVSDRAYIYSVTQGRWTPAHAMSAPRYAIAGTLASNGRVYVVGGSTTLVEEYDPTSDTWATRAPMLAGRYTPTIIADAGRLYVFGGLLEGSFTRPLATTEVYDPLLNQWTALAPMATARSHAGAARALPGWLLSIAGDGESTQLDSVEDYAVSTNTWGAGVPDQPTPTPTATSTPTLTPTATHTLTPTLTPTPTATPGVCAPRPPITLDTTRPAFGQLRVVLTAMTLPATPTNWLRRIRFDRLDNARVTIRGFVDREQPFTIELSDRPRQVIVAATWRAQGPYTIRLTVEDDCNPPWRTFVGAGAAAF